MANHVPNGSLYGFYRALVINDADPEKQGRVKVHIPDVMLDKGWCGEWCKNGIWARPANNWIGGRNTYDTEGPRCNYQDAWYQGSCMIPPKGSHVFVIFEKADPSHPFYTFAADYGQTKVLPENRVGPQWWKKWTPIKTHAGRCLVFSDDDPYDCRVELTGKKRQICHTPDGDTQSVFNIDGNQTTILIDERPSKEHVLIKDYRGNYIKMIQDGSGAEGVQDQLHVFMKDDIHIETPKNIYIKAGQSIHVTADQDIYITANQNMYIYVAQHFSEMANLIDRVSKTNDNRTAGVDINDSADNNLAHNAAVTLKCMGGTNCSRSSGGVIADGAGGNMSIMSKGTMSILGHGGTMIDGPTTSINNGSAPITPTKGITPAATTPMATLPKPDGDRHFTSSDDGWDPVATEENPQNKCHNKFWKPQYNWSGLSQCEKATVNIGGGGGSAPPSSSSGNSNSSNSDTIKNSNTSNNTNNNNSSSNTTTNTNNQVSITESISKTVDNIENLPLNPSSCDNLCNDIITDTVNDIHNGVNTNIENCKDCINTITNIINENIIVDIKNETYSLLNECGKAKVDCINTQLLDGIDNKILTEDVKKSIDNKIDEANDVIENEIYALQDLDPLKIKKCIVDGVNEVDTIQDLTSNISDSTNNYVDNIISNDFKECVDSYASCTKSVDPEKIDKLTNELEDKFKDNLSDTEEKLKDKDYYKPNLNIKDKYPQTEESIKNVIPTILNEYVNKIDPTDPIFNNAGDKVKDNIDKNIIKDDIQDCVCDIISDDNLDPLIEDILIKTTDPKEISSYIKKYMNEEKYNIQNCCIQNIKDNITPAVDNVCDELDDKLNIKINPIDISDKVFESNVKPKINSETTNTIVDQLAPLNDDDIKDNFDNKLNEKQKDNVDDNYSDLPNELIDNIVNTLPSGDDIGKYINQQYINDFSKNVCENIPTVNDVTDKLANKIDETVKDIPQNEKTKELFNNLNPEDLMMDYDKVCKSDLNIPIKDIILDDITKTNNEIFDTIINPINETFVDLIQINDKIDNADPFINSAKNDLVKGTNDYLNNLKDTLEDCIDDNLSDKNICKPEADNCLKDSVDDIIGGTKNILDKLKDDINYDITEDLEVLKNNTIEDTQDKIKECLIGTEETKLNLVDTVTDIIEPIDNVYKLTKQVEPEIDKALEDYFPVSNMVNPMIDTLTYSMCDNIKYCICSTVNKDIYDNNKENFDYIQNMINNTQPSKWTMDQIIDFNNHCKPINEYIMIYFSDPNLYVQKLINIDYLNNLKDCVQPEIDSILPNTDKYSNILKSIEIQSAINISNNIKNICKESIVLTENIIDNDFDKNIDLTKIYTIPGVESSKHKCLCDEDPESMWCDPDIVGGCGVSYEYTLYLQDKFYNPIIPILYNDEIKTIGFSLNPNLDKLSDITYRLHSVDIINSQKDLIDYFYDNTNYDIDSCLYIKRIDDIMNRIDQFDFCCIVNLLDFEKQNYRWLRDISDMDKYTHEMVDDKFINYISYVLKHVFFKQNNNGIWKRRSCRIILNIGNRSFENPSDKTNEKFSIYPNCGFIRELIMKLSYDLKISSNYMSITANENNNLYYYNPYSEFKNYDDEIQHQLVDYDVCTRDIVDDKKNGEADCIIYGENGNIDCGYAKFYTDCETKSYALSYMDNLIDWFDKPYDITHTIIEHFTYDGNKIDSNIMNYIYSPNARKCMRYFYRGHDNYFKYKDLVFDPDSGEVE